MLALGPRPWLPTVVQCYLESQTQNQTTASFSKPCFGRPMQRAALAALVVAAGVLALALRTRRMVSLVKKTSSAVLPGGAVCQPEVAVPREVVRGVALRTALPPKMMAFVFQTPGDRSRASSPPADVVACVQDGLPSASHSRRESRAERKAIRAQHAREARAAAKAQRKDSKQRQLQLYVFTVQCPGPHRPALVRVI